MERHGMREQRDEDRRTASSPTGQGQALRRQFEAAWQEALKGGPVPAIEAYLDRAAEAERSTLHDELREVERQYQQRLALGREAPAVVAAADPGGSDEIGAATTLAFVPAPPTPPP